MALLFPSDPEVDDIFGDWKWDGSRWIGWRILPPGPPGPEGPAGPAGSAGGFTRTVVPFTPPAIGDSVTVELESTSWIAPHIVLMIEGVGYIVDAISGNDVTLRRVEEDYVIEGPQGPPGQDGRDGVDGAPGRDGYPIAAIMDGTDVPPGEIGEYREFVRTAALGMTANTVTSVGTLPLTAGDWQVWGNFAFTNTAALNGVASGSIHTALNLSAALPENHFRTVFSMGTHGNAALVTNTLTVLQPPPRRFNSAAPLTINLVGMAVAAGNATGFIAARRTR